jgi:hypothetical protein
MRKLRTCVLLAAALLTPLGLTGCFGQGINPFGMGIFTPIPVMPWTTEVLEKKLCHPNDYRTPIMPPIRDGYPPPICEDPPGDAEVLRVMPRVSHGVPYVYEEFRDNIRIVYERLVDRIDPPRFFPLVGPAQLHHCHWKCTIYYTETIESGYPFPYRCKRPRVEVVYIDKDHLHLYVHDNPEAQQSIFRDTSGY